MDLITSIVPQLLHCDVFYQNFICVLTFNNDILTIFPSIIFLIFGHSLLSRYSHCIVQDYLGLDLRRKPWCRNFVVTILHLHLTCTWIFFVAMLRETGSLFEFMFEDSQPTAIVHSTMLFIYTCVSFIPCCTLIYEMTMESMVTRRVVNRGRIGRYNLRSELGSEEILAHRNNLYIPRTGKHHAYEIERSCSSFMLMDLPRTHTLRRCNSYEFQGKVSIIEDMIARGDVYADDDDIDYYSANEN